MLAVAQLQHLPPRVLPSIQAVEGGAVGTVSHNRDGSEDLGVMQINTRWLPVLAVRFGADEEAVRSALIRKPCLNILVASAILRAYLRETNGNILQAVGDYHSHTPLLNHSYQAEVIDKAQALFAQAAAHP
ncbi:lytic transglycosylase domain-containing protein [Acidisoma cellulosilytica]|uniref:Lytic transglycosylase domain-containing protein n=2 Tax=Acidisoma cellulosilyticum TaxID=2802395 RepID=A0A963Z3X6_9PROT|nr:lytic transglycosylase domain-containing protein [Acidisoma cellulosilyticum]